MQPNKMADRFFDQFFDFPETEIVIKKKYKKLRAHRAKPTALIRSYLFLYRNISRFEIGNRKKKMLE